jgi:hypothetical protein
LPEAVGGVAEFTSAFSARSAVNQPHGAIVRTGRGASRQPEKGRNLDCRDDHSTAKT